VALDTADLDSCDCHGFLAHFSQCLRRSATVLLRITGVVTASDRIADHIVPSALVEQTLSLQPSSDTGYDARAIMRSRVGRPSPGWAFCQVTQARNSSRALPLAIASRAIAMPVHRSRACPMIYSMGAAL